MIFAICLGSQFKTHKVMGSVLSFFGIIILCNIVGLIITSITLPGGFGTVMMITRAGEKVTNYSYIYIIETLWSLAAGVFFFFGSRYILSKRLNLV